MFSYTTVSSVDVQVRTGEPLAKYNLDFDIGSLPRYVGDWSIRAVEDRRNPGTGIIVAIPSNSRTRLIYLQGRRIWLGSIGYDKAKAENYIRASNTVKLRWDHDVATFVFDQLHMDEFIIESILTSSHPRREADEQGICTLLNRGKLVAGCQIIKNIRGLKNRS